MPARIDRFGARVLAVVAVPRYAAAAALDGWGLAPNGFRAWNLRPFRTLDEKARVLARRVVRMARSARPVQVVLGVPLVDDFRTKLLRAALGAAIRDHGLAVTTMPIRETRHLVLGRFHGLGEDALPVAVVRGFLPELAPHVSTARLPGYYWRNAFEAVALAIAGLVEIAPRAAAALALPEAFESDALARGIAESDARKYPALPEHAPDRTETTVAASAPREGSAAPMPAADHAARSARRLRRTTAGPPDPGRLWEGAQLTNQRPSAQAVGT